MAAVVAPSLPSLDLHLNDATAVARKRRREILSTQRTVNLSEAVSTVPSLEIHPDELVVSKIRRLNEEDGGTADSDSTKSDDASKKTQMKYDPPPNLQMTKEETAAWRREQRRKRNRESAAASRQRQRDRIVELEEELEEWKAKFNSLAKRIKELESSVPKTEMDVVSLHAIQGVPFGVVSPNVSPRLDSCASPIASQIPLLESSVVSPDKASVKEEAEEVHSKLIPRQA